MSQAGAFLGGGGGGGGAIETVTGNDGLVVIPTSHNINLIGAVVANGTNALAVYTKRTASDTETIQVQYAAAIASTDGTKVGLAAFSNSQFSVDSTGFVTLSGGAVGETITGNSGGALSPTAGNWNILGASAAAGTTPVTTAGAVSTLTVKVQTSQAIASTDATKIGLCNFNSADFTVDANGFVSIFAGAFKYTNVTHADSPYTVLTADQYISCDTSGGVISLLFPNAPTTDKAWIIKDRTGNAGASNVTITTVGGAVNIDGATTYLIGSNYGSVQMLFNGTTFEIY